MAAAEATNAKGKKARSARRAAALTVALGSVSGVALAGALDSGSATGANAVAYGPNAKATTMNSVAIGNSVFASAPVGSDGASIAIGYMATTTGNNAIAMGQNSLASGNGGLTFGPGSTVAGTQGTDAVNVNQLNDAMNNAASNTAQQVQQGVRHANAYTNQQISVVRMQMNSLGATAMAASSLIPNARAQGNFQMCVAAGTYGDESALALGANWYVSDRVLLNAHVARSTGSGAGAGASVGATIDF